MKIMLCLVWMRTACKIFPLQLLVRKKIKPGKAYVAPSAS